jgi:transketolase
LNDTVFQKLQQPKQIALKDILSPELEQMAAEFPGIVVLNADTAKSCGVNNFFNHLPDQSVQIGIAEQNMVLTAAGLWTTGKIPIVTTFAIFACLRACEQIRTSIAYPKANVKILASHGGLNPAEDGATHQCTEDLAIMRAIPNMTVIAPADAYSAITLLRESLKMDGPVYLRYSRAKTPVLYDQAAPLRPGHAEVLLEGDDLTFFACGSLVYTALRAAEALRQEGISAAVVDVHTVKPLDEATILQQAGRTGAVVCAEDHSVLGGLGSAISELLSWKNPVAIERIGIRDKFAESGNFTMLLDKYGMSVNDLCQAARRVVGQKQPTRKAE